MSSCSSRKVVCRSALAPAVHKFSCTACEACPHICISEGKDRSLLVDALCHYEFEMSVSVLCDRKICDRSCIRIELCLPEEVLAVIAEETRAEAAAKRKTYRYRAQYSLDVGDGIEEATLRQLPNPETILENYQQREALYAAIMSLPEKQAKRIYAKYFLGLTINEIAQIEGVSKSRISESIRTGLKKLKKFF